MLKSFWWTTPCPSSRCSPEYFVGRQVEGTTLRHFYSLSFFVKPLLHHAQKLSGGACVYGVGACVYGVGACVYGVGACVYGNPMILVSAQVPLVLGLGLRVWGLGLTIYFIILLKI